ncbi:MAG: PIN domain-containing protein [Boseongicola sp.]|nr:PIN domain-containing protein [Boseongicola sp.]
MSRRHQGSWGRPASDDEVFEGNLDLPDPDDNHVLEAAISTSASVIVTDNLGDFPAEALAPHAIDAISANDFLADTFESGPCHAAQYLR